MLNSKLLVSPIDIDFPVSDIENDVWPKGGKLDVSRNWNGSPADAGRHFSVTALWSDVALYFRFNASQGEPLVITSDPQIERKTPGLWKRDVCEVFIAPDRNEPRRYFEFEVAPNGEWLDLAIDGSSGERITDWEYHSGMETASRIDEHHAIMAIKIPFAAFGKNPKAGDVWLGNIFRCVGQEPDRGYLAWQPTFTEKPNFHVPEKFGEFVFAA